MIPPDQMYPQQRALLKASKKYIVIDGGVGTGKTAGCIHKLVTHCIQHPGQQIIVAAQTYRQLIMVFLQEWKALVPRKYYKIHMGTELKISMPDFDAELWLAYMDQPDAVEKVKGFNASGFYLVQGEQLKRVSHFDTMNERVRIYKDNPERYIRLIDCNPGNPAHFIHQRFINPHSQTYLGSDQVDHIHVETTPENSAYTQEDIDEWRRTWTDAQFNRMVQGLWVGDEGLCYPVWQTAQIEPDQVVKFWVGLDPGQGQHEFGMTWLGVLDDGSYGVLDEARVKLGERGLDYVAGLIEEKSEYWGGKEKYQFACIDWSDTVYRVNIPNHCSWFDSIYHPHGSRTKWFAVKAGVVLLEQCLRTGILKVNQSCVKTAEELRAYAWGSDGEPDKKAFDPHILDALRYIWIRVYNYDRDGVLNEFFARSQPADQ